VRSGPLSQTEDSHRRALIGRAACLAAGLLALATTALAQEDNRPIFNRFNYDRAAPEAWQVLGEVPVYLRPQVDPDAEILQNRGINLVVSFRPRNRVYFSRSYGFGQMQWDPTGDRIDKVQLTTMEVSEIINASIKREAILSFGLGLGLMSGLIRFDGDNVRSRLEPYFPLQFGVGFYPSGPVMLELKIWHAFFLGPGPVVSATRGLIGVGYSF